MDDKAVKAIESALAKGDSVEIKPGPNGTVKILQVKRKIINTGSCIYMKDVKSPIAEC